MPLRTDFQKIAGGGGGFLGVVIDKVFVGVESMFWLSVAAACE